MWSETLSQRLRNQIETALNPLSGSGELYHIVSEPLFQVRRGLTGDDLDKQPWPLLPVIVCEAAGGCYEPALPAAASLQLMLTAGDVFDDLEDMDSTESLVAKYGAGVAINAATVLLVLAEKEMSRLRETGLDNSLIIKVFDSLNSHYITACIGQHADISLDKKLDVSEEDYLQIVSRKSASQVECACHIGALLSGMDGGLVRIFSSFGYSLGMASQIANDIQGISHGSDIQKRKITLPFVYALNNLERKYRREFAEAFNDQSGVKTDPDRIRELLFRSGSIHYATVKMEYYKQEALGFLDEAQKAGATVERLKPFLE